MQTTAAHPEIHVPLDGTPSRASQSVDIGATRSGAFDLREKLLPDGVTLIDTFDLLTDTERRFVGQIQARSYTNLFGALQRFIGAGPCEAFRDDRPEERIGFDAPVASGAADTVRQVVYRRMENSLARCMPTGYRFVPDVEGVARAISGKPGWAVRAFAAAIEFLTQVHCRESDAPDENLSPLFRDVLLHGRAGESLHATVAEIEWVLLDAALTPDDRDAAIDAFIELVEAVDGVLQAQSRADTRYFAMYCARPLDKETLDAVTAGLLKAYRWQFLLAGMRHPRFRAVLRSLVTAGQAARIKFTLASLA